MNTYIVTYEVYDTQRKNKLKEKMRTFPSYCPVHDNCWALRSEMKPAEIRDLLGEQLIEEDRVFVIRSGVHAAWRNTYDNKNSDWLKENL